MFEACPASLFFDFKFKMKMSEIQTSLTADGGCRPVSRKVKLCPEEFSEDRKRAMEEIRIQNMKSER